jgi:L-arabinokinase
MHLLYYLTAHGYGHAVRACAIASRLSPDTHITFRTTIPASFFEEELHRPFSHAPGQFDLGCIQKDSVTVDIPKTLATYASIADTNARKLSEEVSWCRAKGFDAIVSDITPFAFEVARGAGIRSVAITNFTWFDIYEPYARNHPWFTPYLESIVDQYGMADLLLCLAPSDSLRCFPHQQRMPLVGRTGTDRSAEIRARLGIDSSRRLGLIYTSSYGMEATAWHRLNEFPEWSFAGLYPLGSGVQNYQVIDKNLFSYPDMTASADLVISKIGYGVVSECLLNGVPLLYLPRDHFAEYPVLEAAVRRWGHGYCLDAEAFNALDWKQALEALSDRGRPSPRPSHGARECAAAIEDFVRA